MDIIDELQAKWADEVRAMSPELQEKFLTDITNDKGMSEDAKIKLKEWILNLKGSAVPAKREGISPDAENADGQSH